MFSSQIKKQKAQLSNPIKKRWQSQLSKKYIQGKRFYVQGSVLAAMALLASVASAARVAPYFEVARLGNSSNALTSLKEAKSVAQVDDIILAFVLSGGGCNYNTNHWSSNVFSEAQAFVKDGGRVTISFGGVLGNYLEQTCKDAKVMAQKMSELVKQTSASGIDFAIERSDINAEAHKIRSEALKIFQKTNANIEVSFTLSASPDGLNAIGKATLKSAVDTGVKIKYVNLMLMDYGTYYSEGKNLGKVGEASLNKVKELLKEYFPSASEQQLWAMLGATPMIGQNDIQSEVFQLDDAQYLVDQVFKKKNIGLVSYWLLQRDQAGTDIVTSSGLPNLQKFDFYKTFKGGKLYTPTNLNPGKRISDTYKEIDHSSTTSKCRSWREGDTYKVGNVVEYQGKTYTNKQAHTAWLGTGWNPVVTTWLWSLGGFCIDKAPPQVVTSCKEWDPSSSYVVGQVVGYQGGYYVALTAMGQTSANLTPATTLTTWQKVPECKEVAK